MRVSLRKELRQDIRALSWLLFDQLCLVGLFWSYLTPPEEPNEDRYMLAAMSRVRFANVLSNVLEKNEIHAADFFDGPFVYNTVYWKHPEVLGGYVSDLPVSAREITHSFFSAWNLHLKEQLSNLRFFKSALWFAQQKASFVLGLEYLINLHYGGYAANTKEFIHAGLDFIDIAVRIKNNAEFFSKLRYDGTLLPDESLDYIDAFHNQDVDPIRIEIIIEWLIDHLNERVSESSKSLSADEWLVSFARVNAPLQLLFQVHFRYKGDVRLAPTSCVMLTRLEEICADISAAAHLFRNFRRNFDPITLVPHFGFGEHVWEEFRSVYGNDWVRGLQAERVLVPDALAPLLDNATTPEWPDEWMHFSPRCAFALAAATNIPMHLMRTARFARDDLSGFIEVDDLPSVAGFLLNLDEAMKMYSDPTRTRYRQYLKWQDEVSRMPDRQQPPQVSNYPEEMRSLPASFLEEMAKSLQALPEDTKALLGQELDSIDVTTSSCTEKPEISLPEDMLILSTHEYIEIEAVLARAHFALCEQDILLNFSERLQQINDVSTIQKLAERTVALFPWFFGAWQERAIALDKRGFHDAAYDSMTYAIVLYPENWLLWHSLAVIADNLEDRELAAVCREVVNAIA